MARPKARGGRRRDGWLLMLLFIDACRTHFCSLASRVPFYLEDEISPVGKGVERTNAFAAGRPSYWWGVYEETGLVRVVVAPRTRREWKCQGPWRACPGDALCVASLAAAAALTSRGRGALIVFIAVAVDAPFCMLWDAAALLNLQAGATTRALHLLLSFASLLLRCSAAFSARMRLRPAVHALLTPCARPTLSMVRSSAYADRVTCGVRVDQGSTRPRAAHGNRAAAAASACRSGPLESRSL